MLEYDFKSVDSEKVRWLEDFYSRGISDPTWNYSYLEGMQCGFICGDGVIRFAYNEKSPPHKNTRMMCKKYRIDATDSEMCKYQSTLIECARVISTAATNDGFYFYPHWFNDINNKYDVVMLYEESCRTGEGFGDILERSFEDVYAIDREPRYLEIVMNWVEGFMVALKDSGHTYGLYADMEFKPILYILDSLRDNCYHVKLEYRPQPAHSKLKLVDFCRLSYYVPTIANNLYKAIQLEGRFQPRPSLKKLTLNDEKEKMFRQDFLSCNTENIRCFEDLLSHANGDKTCNYNFFEGLDCGLICGNGEIHLLFNETSPPHKTTIDFFKKHGVEATDSNMRMYQSVLIENARAVSAAATNDGFHFLPHWFNDLTDKYDTYKLFEESRLTGKNFLDILETIFPDVYAIDLEPRYVENVTSWVEGFMLGIKESGIMHLLYADTEMNKYLHTLDSIRNNCYYVQFEHQSHAPKSALKMVDFFKFSCCIPSIANNLYTAIQLQGRFQQELVSKRRKSRNDKKRHGKERRHRRLGR
jgi:hypothetical protein